MSACYRFGPFELDVAEARLARAGERVDLQPKVFDALRLFVESSGHLVSKEELLERLWPDAIVTEESLTQLVRKLRLALGDDPAAPSYLETVPKRGYRFVAEVVPVGNGGPDRAAAAQSRSQERRAGEETRGGTGRPSGLWRSLALAVAVALLAVVIGVGSRAWRGSAANPILSAGEPRRVTASAAREGTPAISRDGRFAAVSTNTGVDGALELELVPLDGGRPIPLTATPEDEWDPRFSPAGDRLLFLRGAPGGGSALWSMGLFGGDERKLAPEARTADWSPDAGAVALARPAASGSILERLDLGNGTRRDLARAGHDVSSLAWSPDGAHLAYLDGSSIVILELATGMTQSLRAPARHVRTVVWESASNLITDASWSDGASRISRVRLADGAVEPLLVGPPGVHELALASSGRMVYISEHKVRQIWKFDANGGGATALDLPTTVEGFDVDATGRRLAFTDWDPAPGGGTLGLLDLGSGVRRELGRGLCPAFSHDGAKVAALGDRPGEQGLFVIDLASFDRLRVAADLSLAERSDGALFRCPDFSPDDGAIAYRTVDERGSEALWAVDLATGVPRRLEEGSFGAPSWSPDGATIAVCDYGVVPARLRLVAVRGGGSTLTGLVCPFRARALWDGSDALWLLENQKQAPRLVRLGLDGERQEEVALGLPRDPSFWGVFEVRRSADGGWFVLTERYESDLFALDPGTNETRR